jgi:phage tail sheath protein FI
LLIAAVPLAQIQDDSDGADAQQDWPRFLEATGVLEPLGSDASGRVRVPSAFVQLVWPWLWTTRSDDLPHRLEPPDGLFCGVLARNALNRGTYRSIAGSALADVIAPDPMPAIENGADSMATRLSERVCLIGPEPEGMMLLSDVTSSLDPAWRGGGVSRLMATLLRAARRVGEAELFEANGEALWLRVRRSLETLLEDWWLAGALGGATPAEAFAVRCGRETMSQNDLDNGRVKAEVSILPATAVERITVVFDLAATGSKGAVRGVA